MKSIAEKMFAHHDFRRNCSKQPTSQINLSLSPDERMKSEWYICRYEKKEFCHWDNTGGIVEHYAKCNTPGTGRQTAHVLTFTGNTKQLKAERAESRTVIGEPKSTKPREKRRGVRLWRPTV